MNQSRKLVGQAVQGPQGKFFTIKDVFQQQNGYTLYNTSDSNFLIKVYDSDKYTQTERNALRLLKSHPNITQTFDAEMIIESKTSQVILMEKGIIMEKILTKLQNLNERQVLKILQDLSKSLTYIHSQGVIHRNIRTPSIIFGKDGKFKIQNFQHSAFQVKKINNKYWYKIFNKIPSEIKQQIKEDIEQNTDISIRTPEQMDLNSGYPLTEKVDIYGLGCLAYQAVYNRTYDQKNPIFTANVEWSTFSEKLCYLIKIMLATNPIERPTSKQIEQYLETFYIQSSVPEEIQNQEATTQNHIPNRSKSQNSIQEVIEPEKRTSSEITLDKLSGFQWSEVNSSKNEENRSSFYTRCIKIISKFSNKTEGWVIACIEENEEGPQQKYLRFLIVKAWTKKEKISKFYSALNQKLKKNCMENTVVTLKSLILLHNYFKKGPYEVLILDNKEHGPDAILNKIYLYWLGVEQNKNTQKQQFNKLYKSEGSAKDKARSVYTTEIIKNYSKLLIEKMRLCVYYSNYFEGNYSLNPFFNSMLKTYKPLSISILENLLRYWEKCLAFSTTLFKEPQLVKIQFSLGLSIIDEIYCLLSLLTHLLFAFKHSTNYIEYNQFISNFNQMKGINQVKLQLIDRILQLENSFIKNYTLSTQFFRYCYNSSLFKQISTMIPQLKLSLIDVIKNIPLLQQIKGEFNLFDFLSYGKSIEGIKLPLSYGQAVSNIKQENDQLINLNMQDDRLQTVSYNEYSNKDEVEKPSTSKKDSSLIKDSSNSRLNHFEQTNKGNEINEPIRKPTISKEQQANFQFAEQLQDQVKINKLLNQEDISSQFDIYNEFSHQTISHDFNENVQAYDQEKQKHLKLFEYDQNIRNSNEDKTITKEEVPKAQPKEQTSLIKQKSFVEKQVDQKKSVAKKQNSGYQDLSFSDEDDEQEGLKLQEEKPTSNQDFGQQQQKTIITRAMIENEEFLALPNTSQEQSGNQKKPSATNQNNPFLQEDFLNQPFPQQQKQQINEQKSIFNQFNPMEKQGRNSQTQQQQTNIAWFPQNNNPNQAQFTNQSFNNFGFSQNNYFQQQPQQNSQQPQPVQNQFYNQQNQFNKSQFPLMYQLYQQQQQQQQPLQGSQQFSQQLKPQQLQNPPIQLVPQQQLYPQNVVPQTPANILSLQITEQAKPTQAFELYKFITQELQTKCLQDAADWIINVAQLTIDKQIGTGSSCDVFLGYCKGNVVAIKKMKIKSITEKNMKEFRREITALVKIKPHSNLVSLLGISQKDDELYIVTEYCAGGTLFDLLHRRKNMMVSWPVRIRFCLQIASGMAYLHEMSPPIIHRDLKSLNLLLDNVFEPQNASKINLKIADFGLARAQMDSGEQMTGVLGTFHWMAPEIFESKPYSTKADVYSFGIVLWEICSREPPYQGFSTPHAIMKYVTFDKGRPDLKSVQDGCPIALIDLMNKCWDHDPNRRPRFSEIISMLRNIV